ncbi:sugar phosphate nucleotidyltransferase [Heyndrickxia coagulans]|uniref:sugar phosphate nucleotidyltransferase n=1 Tax=Heyndrickxia coagulans TaxID=1398 RepID=UPI0002FEA8E6|nr:sugar phosphate nucleotidyltransferase [Heyndrickxia coagulans]
MKLVLLSGGSGKRLWPLSNDARSKQFLKVLSSEDGKYQSMVQRVWDQLKLANLDTSTLVATSKFQVEVIQNQLNYEPDLIVEPTRRDTFPAIALAASYLYSELKTKDDEAVVVLPVDPFVDSDFFSKLKGLEDVINNQKDIELALIGVRPTYPSEKYGYIVPEKFNKDIKIAKVSRFTEKPNQEDAKLLIEQGAMWNCGVFAFRLSYLIDLLSKKNYPVRYDELLNQYHTLPKISFDYEVVEKATNIAVLTYEGYWKDLGTWNTLTEEMKTNQIGKGIISEDSNNTHLINELDIPVTVLGVSNVVVAVSPDGILISDKEKSPKIKEYVNGFDDKPMYEERRWGWYRVLEYVKYNENLEMLTKRIALNAGQNLSYHYHLERSETWTIIKGKGIVIKDDNIVQVSEGDVVQIHKGERHALKAITDLEVIEVQTGSMLIDEDVIRLFYNWDEIKCSLLKSQV